jgi:L-fucose isomerase-like protein
VNSPTEDLEAEVAAMREWVTFEAMEERQVNAVAALRLTMAELVERHGLSALCVQCFPEFQRAFGIYPCLANSLVTMNQVPVVCETDVHGAITAALLHAATLYQSPPFFADLTIRHPERDNVELLWHCGSFPVNLAEEGVRPRVGEHFIMPEAAAGVGHWRIRGGEITLARFAGHQREYRLAFGEGRGSDGPPTVGTYLWLEVDDWSAWERQFIRGPYIHHVAGVHGSLSPVLCEACRYLPGIQPDPVGQSVDAVENFWWQEK